MDLRELKALELAARSKITFDGKTWSVPSQSRPGACHKVTLGPSPNCTCEDFELRREPCKHITAARLVCARDHKGEPPPIQVDDSIPTRRTYKQNWPAYDESQRIEKRRLQVLLAELCKGFPEPARQTKLGRKPVPIADRLFGLVFKVYCGLSSRRYATDMEGRVSATYGI